MKEIDLYKVIKEKNPKMARRLPRFIINYLRRIVHERDINESFVKYADLKGIDFARAMLRDMNISYHSEGMDALDPNGRYLFTSNHPFGGMDGLMLADEICKRYGAVKSISNDILMNIEPLNSLFLPVNKHGKQTRENVDIFNDVFSSNTQIITFPAGLCSRRTRGVVEDLEWKTNFIKKAVSSKRDIVPVYFSGELSNFFYNLYSFRKAMGIKLNIEMLYLVDEMFRQKGENFHIIIGKPIPYTELLEGRNPAQAALFVRGIVYGMRHKNK